MKKRWAPASVTISLSPCQCNHLILLRNMMKYRGFCADAIVSLCVSRRFSSKTLLISQRWRSFFSASGGIDCVILDYWAVYSDLRHFSHWAIRKPRTRDYIAFDRKEVWYVHILVHRILLIYNFVSFYSFFGRGSSVASIISKNSATDYSLK